MSGINQNEFVKAETWISVQLSQGAQVSAFDLIEKFEVDQPTAIAILKHFENRRSSHGHHSINAYNNNNNSKAAFVVPQQFAPYQQPKPRPHKPNVTQSAHNLMGDGGGAIRHNSAAADPNNSEELPLGWAKLKDNTGYYFYNVVTQQRQRFRPIAPAAADAPHPMSAPMGPVQRNMDHIEALQPNEFIRMSTAPNQETFDSSLTSAETWGTLVDAIQMSVPLRDQYNVFKAMKAIAANLLKDDIKFRTLWADNQKVQERILVYDGGYEFLLSLGYREVEPRKLVCRKPHHGIVYAAIEALDHRLQLLEGAKHEQSGQLVDFKNPVRYAQVFEPQGQETELDNHAALEAAEVNIAQHISSKHAMTDVVSRQEHALQRAHELVQHPHPQPNSIPIQNVSSSMPVSDNIRNSNAGGGVFPMRQNFGAPQQQQQPPLQPQQQQQQTPQHPPPTHNQAPPNNTNAGGGGGDLSFPMRSVFGGNDLNRGGYRSSNADLQPSREHVSPVVAFPQQPIPMPIPVAIPIQPSPITANGTTRGPITRLNSPPSLTVADTLPTLPSLPSADDDPFAENESLDLPDELGSVNSKVRQLLNSPPIFSAMNGGAASEYSDEEKMERNPRPLNNDVLDQCAPNGKHTTPNGPTLTPNGPITIDGPIDNIRYDDAEPDEKDDALSMDGNRITDAGPSEEAQYLSQLPNARRKRSSSADIAGHNFAQYFRHNPQTGSKQHMTEHKNNVQVPPPPPGPPPAFSNNPMDFPRTHSDRSGMQSKPPLQLQVASSLEPRYNKEHSQLQTEKQRQLQKKQGAHRRERSMSADTDIESLFGAEHPNRPHKVNIVHSPAMSPQSSPVGVSMVDPRIVAMARVASANGQRRSIKTTTKKLRKSVGKLFRKVKKKPQTEQYSLQELQAMASSAPDLVALQQQQSAAMMNGGGDPRYNNNQCAINPNMQLIIEKDKRYRHSSEEATLGKQAIQIFFADEVAVVINVASSANAYTVVQLSLVARGFHHNMAQQYHLCIEDCNPRSSDEGILVKLQASAKPLEEMPGLMTEMEMLQPRFLLMHKDQLE